MALSRLIYKSSMSQHCNLEEIDNILNQSRTRNTDKNITGVLYYSNQFFFQCLEGELSDIEQVFQLIAQDKRHTDVRLVDVSAIDNREFGDWSMAYVFQSEKLIPLHKELFNTNNFDPRETSAKQAYALTSKLKRELPKAYCSVS